MNGFAFQNGFIRRVDPRNQGIGRQFFKHSAVACGETNVAGEIGVNIHIAASLQDCIFNVFCINVGKCPNEQGGRPRTGFGQGGLSGIAQLFFIENAAHPSSVWRFGKREVRRNGRHDGVLGNVVNGPNICVCKAF